LLDPEAAAPEPGALLVDGGRIAARLRPDEKPPEDAASIDLDGLMLAPGFLDLHFHGSLIFAEPDRFADALRRDSAELVRHGTTAFLATTVAWERAALLDRVERLAAAVDGDALPGAAAVGIHLEGPWIAADAAGAQPVTGIRPYESDEGAAMLAAGSGLVRMVTFAPESDGADALLDRLTAAGVVPALGHSRVDAAGAHRAAERGARHVTHLWNAMGPAHQRAPGLAGAALADDRLTCDLICDGAHVHPDWVRTAFRAKKGALALISDRVDPPADEAGSYGSGELRADGDTWRLPDGRLAGSRLTLDRAVANVRGFADCSLLEAVAACTVVPARILGIEAERGTLRPGARADFALLDPAGAVTETWLAGRALERGRS
jgi:N-acetylglucosamine-6-phosphate deacetylase